MVFAEARELDIVHDDHMLVIAVKERAVDERFEVRPGFEFRPVSRKQLIVRPACPIGCPDGPGSGGILSQRGNQVSDEV